jgi:sec-independent protein translocase protein TatB
MFNIGITEMLMIAVVALVVIGPRKLPSTLRTIGKAIAQFRRVVTQIKDEVGYDEVVDEVVRPLREGMNELNHDVRSDPYSVVDDSALGVTAEYPESSPDDFGALPELSANAYPDGNSPSHHALQAHASKE